MHENQIVRRAGLAPVLCAALLLAACAGTPQRDDPSPPDRYQAYAGEPVGSFSYFGRFDGWRPLSRSQLVVWTRPNTPYLLTVESSCIGLESATRIGVSSRLAHTVTSDFDAILVDRERCRVTEIRPIDDRRMKDEEKAAK